MAVIFITSLEANLKDVLTVPSSTYTAAKIKLLGSFENLRGTA